MAARVAGIQVFYEAGEKSWVAGTRTGPMAGSGVIRRLSAM